MLVLSPCRSPSPAPPVREGASATLDAGPGNDKPDGDAQHANGGDAPVAPAPDGAEPGGPAAAAPTDFRSALAIDLHADVVFQVVDRGRDFPGGDGEWTIDRATRGGLDAQFFPLWLHPGGEDPAGELKRRARAFRRMIEASGGALAVVRTAAEIRTRAAAGRLSALLGIEGTSPLGEDPAAIDPYVEQGLRYLGLTWNDSSAFAEAAAEPRDPPGLTDLGRRLVARANDAGVLLDLAHASAATFWDACRASRSPLLVSHAGLKALVPLARNVDDLQLLALARTGGVLGIVWHSRFLAELPEGETRAPLDALLAHYDHARALGAAAALAVGSDLDGGIRPPQGLDTIADVPVLAAGLAGHGWSDDEIRGVLGENVLRLLDAADAASAATGPAVAREWPAEAAGTCDLPAKEREQLTDRLILPGPGLAADASVAVSWRAESRATAAALEVWGEPGARVDVADASLPAPPDSAAAADAAGSSARPQGVNRCLGTIDIAASGSARLELPAGVAGDRGVSLVVRGSGSSSSVRLDEIVVWLR